MAGAKVLVLNPLGVSLDVYGSVSGHSGHRVGMLKSTRPSHVLISGVCEWAAGK